MRKASLLVGLAVVASIALVILLFKSQISGQVAAWRYGQVVEEAKEALAAKDFERVARLTGAAALLSVGSISEVRELFELASTVHSPDTLTLGERLFFHRKATSEDRISVLHCLESRGERFHLQEYLGGLTQVELNMPPLVAIRARQLLADGNGLGALLLVDSLSQEQADASEIRLLKIRLLAGENGNPLAWRSCRQQVQEFMQTSDSEMAIEAFRLLAKLPDSELQKLEHPNLKTWLRKQNEPTAQDWLLAARWELLCDPTREREVIFDVMALRHEAPEEVARWLLSYGPKSAIFEEKLDLEDPDTLSLYLARLQSYIDSGSWQEVSELLESPHRAMTSSIVFGLRAAVARQLKDDLAHLANLRDAITQARSSENYREYLSLFEIGERLDDEVMQRRACKELVLLPSRFLPGGRELSFLDFQFDTDPQFLAELYQKLYAAKPDDPLICHRKAVIDFILANDCEGSLAILESLLRDYPHASALRCAKALVLSAESPGEALAWLCDDSPKLLNFDGAFERAVYQYLLAQTGADEQAKRVAKTIHWEAVPAYLRSFLNSAPIAD